MTLNKTTLSMTVLYVKISKNDTQHNIDLILC
jgi:hypothetical protein